MKLALLSILIMIVVIPFAFGQLTNDSIVVTTDKASYSEGETIVITGEVRDLYSGTPVSVIVKAPNDDLVSITQVEVGADKKFKNEMTAGGALMVNSGIYTITAQYGSPNRSATISFGFGDTDDISEPLCGAGTVFDEVSNSCVIGVSEIASEPESFCGEGTYYDAKKNACILDEHDIPKLEAVEVSTNSENTEVEPVNDIPTWIKGVFAFWVQGQLTDYELKEAIKFLVNSGIIIL